MRRTTKKLLKPLWKALDLGSKVGICLEPDPETFTVVGTKVSAWRDKLGTGKLLSQATDANRPLYVPNGLNGLPTMRTESNNFIVSGTINLLNNVSGGTILAIFKYPSATFASNTPILSVTTSVNGSRMVLTPNNGATNRFGIRGRRLDSDSALSVASSTSSTGFVNSWVMQCGNIDYANAKANHWTNGVQDMNNVTFLSAGNTTSSDSLGISVLSFTDGTGNAPNGTEISTAFVINATLTNTEREKLEWYATYRLGLISNLLIDHPYKNRRVRR